MANRYALLTRLPQASPIRTIFAKRTSHFQDAFQTSPIYSSTQQLSTSASRQNYNPYLPPPPTPKPARSTTTFRLINSLSGLAVVYLLYCVVDELEYLSGTLMQIEVNHARDHFDQQLERVRAQEEKGPRDRDYERRLIRWREAMRDQMVDLDERLREERGR